MKESSETGILSLVFLIPGYILLKAAMKADQVNPGSSFWYYAIGGGLLAIALYLTALSIYQWSEEKKAEQSPQKAPAQSEDFGPIGELKYCSQCGNPRKDTPYCPYCGARL